MSRKGVAWIIGVVLMSIAGLAVAQQHSGIPAPKVAFAGSSSVPFELYRGNRIFVPISINGHQTVAILDSGASVTTVDRAYARSIGIPPGLKIAGHGTGGTVDAELASGVAIDVGSLSLREMSVGVLDLQAVGRSIGHPVTVVLGDDFLSSAVVSFDWAANRLRMSPTDHFAPSPGASEVTLGHADGPFRTIPIEVAGQRIDALFDLGNGGNLSVAARDWSHIPSLQALPYAEGRSGGVGGLHPNKSVTFPSVTYGGQRFTNVPGQLDGPTESTLATHITNAGIGFLRQFLVDLDFGHDRLYLRPRPDAPPFQRDRSGVMLDLEGGKLTAVYVSPQGPTAKAGLKEGDQIVAVDGQKITSDYYEGADWTHAPAGSTVNLTLADGRTLAVKLADYY